MVKSAECQSSAEENASGHLSDAPLYESARKRAKRRVPEPLVKSLASGQFLSRLSFDSQSRLPNGDKTHSPQASSQLDEVIEVGSQASDNEEGEPLKAGGDQDRDDNREHAFPVKKSEEASLWRWLAGVARSTFAYFSVPPM